MPNCFVIQPFDAGKFDKRFEQVFKPAIIAAGLDPYRVDQDPSVDVPIDAIEKGIRSASICLADITTNNPNVWYELGYAFATETPVVMVCSSERESNKYPFDIQHRTIISYRADAPDDFENLQNNITERIKALLEKGATLRQIAETGQVAPVDGLTQPELTVLAVLAGSVGSPDGMAAVYSVRNDAERANLTKLGFALALRRLLSKHFVVNTEYADQNDYEIEALRITDTGWDWIDANESRFVLRRISETERFAQSAEISDADIPF
jgi:hypothetical protein